MFSRRALIALGAALPALRMQATLAQTSAQPAPIGWITMGPIPYLDDFREGMRTRDHVEGKSYVLHERYASGDAARLPALANELLHIPVQIFLVAGAVPLQAVTGATKTVPVVSITGDPFAIGEAATLARPGGNVTGLSLVSPDLAPKWLELMREALPNLTHVVVLADYSASVSAKDIEALGPKLGVKVTRIEASTAFDLEIAFRRAAELRADAIIVPSSVFYATQMPRLITMARESRIPAMWEARRFAAAGGLISYGPDIAAVFKRAAFYVDRILKGAKPGELPIEQPARFELIVNLKTAKELGIAIPSALLTRADDVIE